MVEKVLEIARALAEVTLKLRDNGTFFSSDNKTQTFNKNDFDKFVLDLQCLIISDVIQTCVDTKLHYKELDKYDPPNLRTPSEVVLNNIIKKIKAKSKKKVKML